MFESLVKWLTGGVGEKVGDYFIQKQKLKQELKITQLQGKIALKTATVKAKIAQQEHLNSWEMAHIANSGWKDELVLLVILAPYIGSFIPGVQDYVLIGFGYLSMMPYWAIGLTVTILLAIYGIRHKNASRISAPGLKDSDVNGVEK